MTRRDVNEGDVFRKGFATNALESGASTGQVPKLTANGEMEFGDAGGGSQPGIVTAEVTVTSAQLKDLLANPVDLVAAPVAGKGILAHGLYCRQRVGATPYTYTDADVEIETNLRSLPLPNSLFSGFDPPYEAIDPVVWLLGYEGGFTAGPYSTIGANNLVKAIQLVNYGSADLLAGDGTLEVVTYYSEIDVP